MTKQDFLVGIRQRFVSNRLLLVLELALVLGLITADQLNLIRTPLTLTLPLFLIGWLSLRLRGLHWRDMGLQPVDNWQKTIVIALVIATAHQLFSTFLLIPFLERVTGQSINLALVEQIQGNMGMWAVSLVIAWVLAAFGEEMVYRGYLLNRFADLLQPQPTGWLFGFTVSVLLFAWGHQYQGSVGLVDNIVSGTIWGGLYLYAGRRNLWLPILAHGFYDTLAFTFAFLGIL